MWNQVMQDLTPGQFHPFLVVCLMEPSIFLFKKPLSSGLVSAIVIAVIVLLVIMVALIYLIFIRRWDPRVRQRVYVDTGGPVRDVARPSVLVRDEAVVYSHVKLKQSRDSACKKHTADDVTYSEVLIFRQQPK
ncbi:uncharacterized protein LOC129109685 isoform X2 [Anoplopoma fimbria]|uniref:uncharacterized protein LOC129109685 isoform X2 n=1 Tax=Anoplopoma fimbria TaxID=229290 RepID=UPI0023ED8BEF|nr:uncharacterized protein LOC129109685 isoform X2 [Anoplopoma fimbria]